MYKIQQLGIGGILDQAIAITRDNFALLLKILLMTFVPFLVVAGLSTTFIFANHPELFDMREHQAEVEALLLRYLPLGIIGLLVWVLLVAPIAYASIIQAVAHVYLGRPIAATQAIKDAFHLWPALVGTAILYGLALVGGFILLIIPYFVFLYWFLFWANVVVIEGTSGAAALWRGPGDRWGNFLPTLAGLGFIIWIIKQSLGTATNFIPSPYAMVIVSSLLQGIITLFSTVCWVVFYFSCRCANENFDLHYLAEAIGDTPALPEEANLPTV